MQAEKLINTLNMPRKEWLEYRKQFIGGSDAPAIVGLHPYKSAFQVWLDKTDPTATEDVDNEAMRQGRDFEDYVARRFTEETGKKVQRRNSIFTHPKYPYIGANIDRWVVGENAGLECKTCSVYKKKDLDYEIIPDYYYVQCMHYMAVTGARRWYLAVLIHQHKPYIFTIERDEQEIAALLKAERDFWNKNVLEGQTPPPDGSSSAQEAILKMFPKAERKQTLLFGLEESMRDYLNLRNDIKMLEKRKDQIQQELETHMSDADIGLASGYEVRWTNCSGRKSTDMKALKEDHPEIDFRDYSKTGKPYRRFDVQEIKEEI